MYERRAERGPGPSRPLSERERAEPLFEIIIEPDVVPRSLRTRSLAAVAAATAPLAPASDVATPPVPQPVPELLGASALGPSSIQSSVYTGFLALVKITAGLSVIVAAVVATVTMLNPDPGRGTREVARTARSAPPGTPEANVPLTVRPEPSGAPSPAAPAEAPRPVARPLASPPIDMTPALLEVAAWADGVVASAPSPPPTPAPPAPIVGPLPGEVDAALAEAVESAARAIAAAPAPVLGPAPALVTAALALSADAASEVVASAPARGPSAARVSAGVLALVREAEAVLEVASEVEPVVATPAPAPPEAPAPPTPIPSPADARQAQLGAALAALEASPDDAGLLFEAAALAHALGQREQAIALYERLLAVDRLNVPARQNLAVLLMDEGAYDRAERLLREALALDPERAGLYVNLGNLQVLRGDARLAALAYRRALSIDPDDAVAALNLARALERDGRPGEALDAIAPLSRRADLPRALRAEIEAARGRVLVRLGRYAEAEQALELALQLDPRRKAAEGDLAVALLGQRRYQAARTFLDRVVDARPQDVAARVNRALVFLAQGDLASAQRDLERAIELEPDNPEARYNYAVLAEQYGNFPFALEEYGRVLELDPQHADTLSNLGRLYLRGARQQGANAEDRKARAQKALSYLDRAVESAPAHAAAHENRGLALLLQGRRVEALSALERARELAPAGDAGRLDDLIRRVQARR